MLVSRHGGDIYRNDIRYDFSININPLGMPDGVKHALLASVDAWNCYPDPECQELVQALGSFHQLPGQMICCGNGAADIIYRLVQQLAPRRAMVLAPTFSEYGHALSQAGCQVDEYRLREERGFAVEMDDLIGQLSPELDMIFFCNPNNPTGLPVAQAKMRKLAEACKRNKILLVVDECFCDFLDQQTGYSMIPLAGEYPQMLIIKAFTKTYAMAGLRLGYCICSDPALISGLARRGQPWSVSVPAQIAGAAALKETEYVIGARRLISGQRDFMKQSLQQLGYQVYDSQANYIFFRDRTGPADGNLWEILKAHQILIRDCANYPGLAPGYYRVAVKTAEENSILMNTLQEIHRMG